MIHSHIWLLAFEFKFSSLNRRTVLFSCKVCLVLFPQSMCEFFLLSEAVIDEFSLPSYFTDDLQWARHWLKASLLWGSGIRSCWISCKWINLGLKPREKVGCSYWFTHLQCLWEYDTMLIFLRGVCFTLEDIDLPLWMPQVTAFCSFLKIREGAWTLYSQTCIGNLSPSLPSCLLLDEFLYLSV